MKCRDCRYFKKGKSKSDHSHCVNPQQDKSKKRMIKDGSRLSCKLFKNPETPREVEMRIGSPLISIRQIPFLQYVNYIKTDKYFSYLRYGDGEWKTLFQESGRNGRAHMITPEFHQDMLDSFLQNSHNFSIFFGMQRNTYRTEGRQAEIDAFLMKNNLLHIPWVSAETFHHASRDGILFPLIEEMRYHTSVIVGPGFLAKLRDIVFPSMTFVEVPATNCYDEKDRIMEDISEMAEELGGEDIIFSFATGPAAEVLILKLQEVMPNNFYIDAGSLWDVFVGQRTRRYTQDKENYTDETIKRNLGVK